MGGKAPYFSVKAFGSSPIAYLTLQDTLSYFSHDEGYIAYRSPKADIISVLGDPVLPLTSYPDGLKAFTDQYPTACFYHIDTHTADILSTHGYYISVIGHQHVVNLSSFKGSWGSHRSLRSGVNKAKRSHVSVIEQRLSQLEPSLLQNIHYEWIQQRDNPYAQSFLTRPLDFKDRDDCRYFFAYLDQTLIGYAFFTPLYHNHCITGYYLDNYRYINRAPKGTCDLLIFTALQCFKDAGFTQVNIGLSPFASLNTHNYRQHPFLHHLFKSIYRLNIPAYGYKGIYQYAHKFHGELIPTYFASPNPFPLQSLYYTWKMMCRSN